MSSDYQVWLARQSELVEKARALVEGFRFKVKIVVSEKKREFLRIYLAKNRLDFWVKYIKNKHIRDIWLCKKTDFNLKNYYLIYLEKEEKFLICTGEQADMYGEYRDSDWSKGKYIVVPMDQFRSADAFFKTLKKRWDNHLQKRMTEWTKPKLI